MIVTIGTDDTLASPGAQLDYYQAVLERMGRRAVDGFARLFVIPQANHGLAARTADIDGQRALVETAQPAQRASSASRYLVDWVERGRCSTATPILTGGGRTLPLCSYPFPKYVGGSAAEPARTAAHHTMITLSISMPGRGSRIADR